jgi:hypothetical protein
MPLNRRRWLVVLAGLVTLGCVLGWLVGWWEVWLAAIPFLLFVCAWMTTSPFECKHDFDSNKCVTLVDEDFRSKDALREKLQAPGEYLDSLLPGTFRKLAPDAPIVAETVAALLLDDPTLLASAIIRAQEHSNPAVLSNLVFHLAWQAFPDVRRLLDIHKLLGSGSSESKFVYQAKKLATIYKENTDTIEHREDAKDIFGKIIETLDKGHQMTFGQNLKSKIQHFEGTETSGVNISFLGVEFAKATQKHAAASNAERKAHTSLFTPGTGGPTL